MPRSLSKEEIREFRQELCDLAAELFARDGYEAVTMRAIASELGVSAMTPYRYFGCKGEIYREVRAAAFRRFGKRVAAAAAGDGDPIERLRALFRAYLAFAFDEPGAYRIMFEFAPPQDADLGPEDAALAAMTWAPLLQTLEAASTSGLVSEDPLTLAHVCWVHVHGLASLEIAAACTSIVRSKT